MKNSNIHHRPFRVVDYDPAWPKQYELYASQIKEIIGDNLLELHHYGSTSIPGMFAKPNIDIYGSVASFATLETSKPAMQNAGFTPRGDYSHISEEYFTVDTPQGERIASVHLFEGSSEVIEGYKKFHDYLIANPEDRDRYIRLKRELFEKFKDDYAAYDSGKKSLIDELNAKAGN